jgi:hypothetical protein
MRLHELEDEGEDLPLIYDIIQQKLKAGVPITCFVRDARRSIGHLVGMDLKSNNNLVQLWFVEMVDSSEPDNEPYERRTVAQFLVTDMYGWKLRKEFGELVLHATGEWR